MAEEVKVMNADDEPVRPVRETDPESAKKYPGVTERFTTYSPQLQDEIDWLKRGEILYGTGVRIPRTADVMPSATGGAADEVLKNLLPSMQCDPFVLFYLQSRRGELVTETEILAGLCIEQWKHMDRMRAHELMKIETQLPSVAGYLRRVTDVDEKGIVRATYERASVCVPNMPHLTE